MKTVATLASLLVAAGAAFGQTFSNAAPIGIPSSGPSPLYPSTISVAGLGGTIVDMTVTLHGVNHTWPDDVDILLVGPGGQNVMLMSDAGSSFDLIDLTLAFNQGAADFLPDNAQILGGTYLPSNYVAGDVMPAPAPVGPHGDSLAAFFGTSGNGDWSLFVADDTGSDTGEITGGWSIEFVVPAPSTAALLGFGGVMALRRRR